MKIKSVLAYILISMSITAMLTGCTPEASSISQAQELGSDTEQSIHYYLPVGTYDSADTAIIQEIDEERQTITFYNTYAARTYTLSYDGTTYVSDKYGTAMSISQLEEGDIVNVNFLKSSKALVDIQISPDAWKFENMTKYDFGGQNSTARVGERTFALTEGVQVFSQGKSTDLMSIVRGDTISVSGIGYDIYSIQVETGHGYVRLSNEDALIGGWIEIGNEVITQVYDDMLIPVAEGEYSVKMYNATSEIEQDITVERNQEVVLDCSGITVPEDKSGHIIFHINPVSANLYIDGDEKDYSSVVKATFGVHQIEVKANGYDTLSKYINVGDDLAEISITLSPTKEIDTTSNNSTTEISNNWLTPSANNTNQSSSGNSSSGSASSNSTVSGNSTAKSATTSNRVYISSPENAEVYVDGVYAGLAPMNFKKTTGSHTITLKKSGCVTKSYTIYLYNDGEDVSYAFVDLDKE